MGTGKATEKYLKIKTLTVFTEMFCNVGVGFKNMSLLLQSTGYNANLAQNYE